MKFLVDTLPYYGDHCPFSDNCFDSGDRLKCPRHWDKYVVGSDINPHKCEHLIEYGHDKSKITIVEADK